MSLLETNHQMSLMTAKRFTTLRVLGPSNGRVWTCIAGVRVLKIAILEGSGFLGKVKQIVAVLREFDLNAVDVCLFPQSSMHMNVPAFTIYYPKEPYVIYISPIWIPLTSEWFLQHAACWCDFPCTPYNSPRILVIASNPHPKRRAVIPPKNI